MPQLDPLTIHLNELWKDPPISAKDAKTVEHPTFGEQQQVPVADRHRHAPQETSHPAPRSAGHAPLLPKPAAAEAGRAHLRKNMPGVVHAGAVKANPHFRSDCHARQVNRGLHRHAPTRPRVNRVSVSLHADLMIKT